MRIAKNKKSIKSNEAFDSGMMNSIDTQLPVESKYDCCTSKIQEAIDCLCEVAADDSIAKDAIANLSVVLLDLKSA